MWAIARGSGVGAGHLVCAVILATCGEVVFSLIWGLYTYQHALIPLYVPPGHGLFYRLAAYAARQPALVRRQEGLRIAVLVGGSLIAAVSLYFFADVWGAWWWIGAALLAAARGEAGAAVGLLRVHHPDGMGRHRLRLLDLASGGARGSGSLPPIRRPGSASST